MEIFVWVSGWWFDGCVNNCYSGVVLCKIYDVGGVIVISIIVGFVKEYKVDKIMDVLWNVVLL